MILAHLVPEVPEISRERPLPAAEEPDRLSQLRELLWKEDPSDAIHACHSFNHDFPNSSQGWSITSHLALRVNNTEISLRAIDRALQIEPNRAEWLVQKANCLAQSGQIVDARVLAGDLAKRLYPTARLSGSVGLLLTRLDMHEAAVPLFADAVKLEPESSGHHYNLATVYRFLGGLEQAEKCLDKTIELNANDVEAWALRSTLRQQTKDRNHVEGLKKLLESVAITLRQRVSLYYALAKELEDLGRFAESFAYLKQGADGHRRHIQYEVQQDIQTMHKICEVFDSSKFLKGIKGYLSAAPIFVIGMPRTGTTLVEQILGSHPVVHAAGELRTFAAELVHAIQNLSGGRPVTQMEMVLQSSKVDFAALGRAYVERAGAAASGAAHFVDKLPMNFLYAGLIHLALPQARIIHVERDPMDTCYAVYKTQFKEAYPYSYNLEELAQYYVAYRQLMDHWNLVLQGVMHTVRYEDLVTDTRNVTQNLLDFCSLSWDENCLNFHQNASPSTTASAAQVRKPIYRSSIGRWRENENELKPVADILRKAGIAI